MYIKDTKTRTNKSNGQLSHFQRIGRKTCLQNQPKYHLKLKRTFSFFFPHWKELYLGAKLIICNILRQRDIQIKEWRNNEDL